MGALDEPPEEEQRAVSESPESASARRHFVNDPRRIVRRGAGGVRAREPRARALEPRAELHRARRRRPRRSGRRALGRRLRPRAAAHRLRRRGHARRRGAGRHLREPDGAPGRGGDRRAIDRGLGVVHIVKNYTGDVMNFGMAAELAAATVETVLVDDDVADRERGRPRPPRHRRRDRRREDLRRRRRARRVARARSPTLGRRVGRRLALDGGRAARADASGAGAGVVRPRRRARSSSASASTASAASAGGRMLPPPSSPRRCSARWRARSASRAATACS